MPKPNSPPRCPRCNSKSEHAGPDLFRCLKCGGLHDGAPDEGGDYSDRSPSARIEREERARARFARRS